MKQIKGYEDFAFFIWTNLKNGHGFDFAGGVDNDGEGEEWNRAEVIEFCDSWMLALGGYQGRSVAIPWDEETNLIEVELVVREFMETYFMDEVFIDQEVEP